MNHQPHPQQFPPTSATTALILSFLSLFCFGIFAAIPALIVASGAKKVIDAYPGHPDKGSVTVARIVSWVTIILTILGILIYGLIFVLTMGGSIIMAPYH